MKKIYNTIFIIACTVYGCTVNGCPSLCRCTSTNVVYCSGKSLTTVPPNIPNSTTILYISQNKITLKDDYAFAGLSALKIMYINDNKITRINEHSFDGLSALTHLYIHGNNITIIDGHSFDGLSAFTHLYLEENTLDCSKCELKKFKAFLLTTKRVFVAYASCDGRPLIHHNFNNCKETITTEAFPSSAGKDNPESTTESITGNQASTTKSTTAQLRQKLLDIDMRLTAIKKQNGTKLRESENGESTDLDTHTMCYNGGVWQNCHESNICVCTAGFLGKQCEYSDGKDTSFMVVFHEGWNSPFGKRKTEHNLSKSVLPSDGIHLAGVEIHSDVRIKLYGFENHDHHSEGFLSLPLRFASTKYTIPSLPAYTASSKSDLKNVLVISPIKQNTTVSIHLKLKSGAITYESKTYKNNDTIKLVINEYNTLQLSHTSDLSGTMVTSSKPVIVISGNQCSYAVPANITLGGCNPFIESIYRIAGYFRGVQIFAYFRGQNLIAKINSAKLKVYIQRY
ncbi:uncharacterized protein [Mytilus edulis]